MPRRRGKPRAMRPMPTATIPPLRTKPPELSYRSKRKARSQDRAFLFASFAREYPLMRTVSSGIVSRVYWGSMGEWPECEITDDDGAKSTWTREGDLARYVG